ncbi:DUF928 domain-containing protein [Leptothoe spongobia]|uniref:DUF928 domain-containing protein n=1 Tax=Leptothoe spongobia TAU-MAC 1115 TaxID=1967444 RepID=A0A947DHB4_9CYAN|nr:DUF928 domain-containing protein [Leptothoe spongobia]MBT9316906.1 DUF928 domain-containing protein [Leptothoe spongobia TAU-MAC 1115]
MFKQFLSSGNHPPRIRAKGIIGLWIAVFISCGIAPVEAQVYGRDNLANQVISFKHDPIQFIPQTPSGGERGSTGRKVDLGTRGPCLSALSPEHGYLTALIPKGEVDFTVSEKPTVWVYVPDTAEDISRMVLTLKNRRTWQVHSFDLEVSSFSPGVIHIPWPSTMVPLAVGDTYDWALSIFDGCESVNGPLERFVEGRIQRQSLSPALEQQLSQALSQRDQAVAYAQHGIWYDALKHLGEAYRADAHNSQLALDWQSLLTALDLDLTDYGIPVDAFNSTVLGVQPLLDCCRESPALINSEP